MSLVDRVREANHDAGWRGLAFAVAGREVGEVHPETAARLLAHREVFRETALGISLSEALDAPRVSARERSQAVAEVLVGFKRDGTVTGWRDEPYAVKTDWAEPALLHVERAAAPLFGVRGFGVHLNGYSVGPHGDVRLWVARRSASKGVDPGKLDQMVAGGQPANLGLRENLIKECAEEAAIGAQVAARAVAVGTIQYELRLDRVRRPDTLFCFDLELPDSFVPRNTDGEVESFELWELDRVLARLEETTDFKFNCALVVIDFLMRRGHLSPEYAGYEWLSRALRGAI
ncbi:MAG: DUF4743 domain-containing protein [Pseudomonadota bacterium]